MRQRNLIGLCLSLTLAGCAGGGASSDGSAGTVVGTADSTAAVATSTGVAASGQSVTGTITYATAPTGTSTTAATTSAATGTASGTTNSSGTVSATSKSAASNSLSISGSAAPSVLVGSVFNFQPNVTSEAAEGLTFSIANCPAWATFNEANGELSGTPGAGDVGTYSNIKISVTDGVGSASLVAFEVAVVASANGVAILSWVPPTENTDGTPLSDLAGFHIYYGSNATSLTQQVDVKDPTAASHTVSNLPQGTWYFSVKAYTMENVESVGSDIASKVVL